MEKVGILVVSYGARAAAMVDAFTRSINYDVKIYVADKQRNPFNVKKAVKHVVIPDLNVEEICKFAESNKDKIDFGIVGPEKPIINGVRDLVEKRTNIPVICPTKKYAIEASKVAQRLLFQEIVPEVNPRFKIFNPKDYKNLGETKKAVYGWLDKLENKAVVKPDKPAAGKGVGVWGDHFTTREQLFEHFTANFQYGSVIIEEKIEGEESSFQAFCDGKHLVPLPETRDYKRAFDGDRGPNCYSEDTEILTKEGWKTFGKLNVDDKVATFDPNTREIEFEKPKEIYWKRYKGKMLHFKNRFLDLLVTPNHRMLVQQRKGKRKTSVVEARNFTGERYIQQGGKWKGKDLKSFILPEYDYKFSRKLERIVINFKDWVRFLGLYLSEGYVSKQKTGGHRVYISQMKSSKHFSKFKEILEKLPFKVKHEKKNKKFRINSVQLAKYLERFGTSREKYIPDYIENSTKETILEFLKSFCLGDGDIHQGKMRFHSSSKKMIDDIQELIIKAGFNGIVTVDKRRRMLNPINKKYYPAHPVYSIEMKDRTKTCIRKEHVKKVDYEGYIGCVTVSTGFVLVRRNNRVAMCGNTGGMGSYKDVGDALPFMTNADRAKEIAIITKIFEKWKAADNKALRGIPFYIAFIHTGKGPKILENNSRPGDPEIQNILPILKKDFVDVCFKILEGNLTHIELEKAATVLTYKVPPNYGGYMSTFPNLVNKEETGKPVNLTEAYELTKKYGERIRVYPASMELCDNETYALKSRAVCVVGIDENIKVARKISLEGINAIKGGALWHRTDIASKQHIEKSIKHMEELRRRKQ